MFRHRISARTDTVLLTLLSMLMLVSFSARAMARDISVWVYHNFPPYIVDIDRQKGISYDLTRRLNALADGQFTFDVEVLPRPRLNHVLENGDPGIVLWVNPAWFGDSDQTMYFWTDPVLVDQNVVISPKAAPFEYDGPASLAGKTLVGVKGHTYANIDGLVTRGDITRVDLMTERQLVQFIAFGRGDVAIIAHSAAKHLAQNEGLQGTIHYAGTPHSTYDRDIMVQRQFPSLNDFVQRAIQQISQSQDWRDVVKSYGLSTTLTQ